VAEKKKAENKILIPQSLYVILNRFDVLS